MSSFVVPTSDVVIVGGSIAGVSAALHLHAAGLNVVLISGRTYLGEDICDSLRLRLPEACDLSHPLSRRLLGEAHDTGSLLRPLHVKLELERALRKAGVPFMLSTAPGEVVRDEAGRLLGLTICNRSGRQLLRCRAVLDSTLRGELARIAGVPLTPPDPSFPLVRRVIGGDEPRIDGEGSLMRGAWERDGEVFFVVNDETRRAPLWAWRATAGLEDGSWRTWMALEQRVRIASYRPGQDQSADGIFAITGERLQSGRPAMTLDDFTDEAISAEHGRLWFTGAIINLVDRDRDAVLRADRASAWGEQVAERLLAALPELPKRLVWQRPSGRATLPDGIEGRDIGARPQNFHGDGFAAVEEVDVLVVGGGTGGAPAGIAAARAGAGTLVAVFLSGMGGVGTLGLIGQYWYGNRVGFTAEMDRAVADKSPKQLREDAWDVEAKMQWYHEEITRAGGMVWYKTMVCGALVQGSRVAGAILATPQGRVAVIAKCVVDATGSADVAAAAGAEMVVLGDAHLASQGTGLPPRAPGVNYQNTDYDFIDETDARDAGSAHATAREKFARAFDTGQLVDSRERRRVVGDYEITPMDIRLARVFPDTINKACSNFDTHGFTVHPLFMIVPPDHDPRIGYVPLRALLPRGIEGILVTGLGISAHRDAMPVIRMQADVQNQGYAAGLIAALVGSGPIRGFAVEEIQRRLVKLGILSDEMVNPADTFPLSDEEIVRSLVNAVDDPEQIDRIFTLGEVDRISRLRGAYAAAGEPRARAFYAFVLAMLGDPSGVADLSDEVARTPWDAGWNYRGMHQFGASMSPLDARIIALGRCRHRDSVPMLVAKTEELPSDAAFSHYRALAEAFETIGDPSAVPALEQLLDRPGLRGHQRTDIEARVATASADSNETSFRNASLIELHLARALYRLDPDNETARGILEAYRRDQRSLFARHAGKLLAGSIV
jgi:hypothetical protein